MVWKHSFTQNGLFPLKNKLWMDTKCFLLLILCGYHSLGPHSFLRNKKSHRIAPLASLDKWDYLPRSARYPKHTFICPLCFVHCEETEHILKPCQEGALDTPTSRRKDNIILLGTWSKWGWIKMDHLLNCNDVQLCKNILGAKGQINIPLTTVIVLLIIFFKY